MTAHVTCVTFACVRRGISLTIALVGLGIAAGATAGATKPLVLNVPLPAVGTSQITEITVRTTGHGVTGLRLHVLSDKAFGNSSAVAVIGRPKADGASSTFTIATMVKRFPSGDRMANSAAEEQFRVGVAFDGKQPETATAIVRSSFMGCNAIKAWDGYFESGRTSVIVHAGDNYTVYELVSMRPVTVQDSPPEEVLDNVIADAGKALGCPTEGDDPGPK